MLWSFIAVCLSAWLYVDASYRGPAWQRWVLSRHVITVAVTGLASADV